MHHEKKHGQFNFEKKNAQHWLLNKIQTEAILENAETQDNGTKKSLVLIRFEIFNLCVNCAIQVMRTQSTKDSPKGRENDLNCDKTTTVTFC